MFQPFYFMNTFKEVFFLNKNCWNSDQFLLHPPTKSRRVINPTKACMSRTVQVYRRTNKWSPSQLLTRKKENLTLNSGGITSLAIQEFLFISLKTKRKSDFPLGKMSPRGYLWISWDPAAPPAILTVQLYPAYPPTSILYPPPRTQTLQKERGFQIICAPLW